MGKVNIGRSRSDLRPIDLRLKKCSHSLYGLVIEWETENLLGARSTQGAIEAW